MDPQTITAAVPTALIAGLTVISPIITAVFTRVNMSPKVKNVIAMVVAALIAVVWVILNGGIAKWEDIFVAAPVIYGLQQAIYIHFLKSAAGNVEQNVGVTDKHVPEHLQGVNDPAPAQSAPVDVPAVEETPAKG